jgi:hypothetical protein
VSAALAAWALDAVVTRTDIPGVDWLVAFPLAAVVVTIFAVAGVANAVNIIDGFNGLAAMCVVMMLGSLAYVAFQSQDAVIALCALAGLGAVMGFFIWNFPAGLIFLGDGGAYFLGFFVAELSILLLQRNPEVSPLCPLLMCIYPIFETVFSMYRRRVVRGGHARRRSPAQPDLPSPDALGCRQPDRQGDHQAQLDDGAVPLAAVHDVRGPVDVLLEQLAGPRRLHRPVRRDIHVLVRPHRPLQGARLAHRAALKQGAFQPLR